MGEAGYKKLIAWQKANDLVKQIYIETRNFPKYEQYGLTSQLRRSSLSVVLNIVEGNSRTGKKELKHFLSIALGSLAETEYLLDFSHELNYFPHEAYQHLRGLRQEVGNLLWKFYVSI